MRNSWFSSKLSILFAISVYSPIGTIYPSLSFTTTSGIPPHAYATTGFEFAIASTEIKPNNYELGEIFGVTLSTKEDVILYAKKLQEMGAANVLVSMAGDGAVLVAEDGSTYKSEAPEGKVKNSVGAGDSMVAGFLYGYLKSGIYEDAFYYGVCTGSASAFSENLATREEVDTLLRNIKNRA